MGSSPIKFCRAVSEELEPERLQKKFLTALLDLQKVERGSIWVRRGNSYQCVQAAGSESEGVIGLSVPVDRPSIVGWVIENGKMTIAEAGKDSRHYKEAEIGITLKSKLILCFPLVLRDGTVYGAMELIDTSAGGDRLNLDPAYLELLQQLIDLGSIALSNSFIHSDQQLENVKLKETLEAIRGGDMILGKSEAFQKVLKTAENYARTDFPVLVTGESGTGKELLAKEIHRLSSRRGKPFLTQNCSAIPDTLLESELFGYEKGAFTGATRDRIGLFEAANGGSLFLDEIGDMPIHLQARMLRFLQSGEVKPLGSTRTRKVDVRIISATNKDLKGAIKKELFREDLFYRLNVLPVHLPSLRERREDIPLLLDHFLKREALKLEIPPKRLSEEALRYAVNHPWRGNIRELENFAKHISVVVGGEVIRPNDLSIHLVADQDQLPSGAATGPGERDAGGEAALSATSLFEGRSWDEIEKAYALYLLEKHLWHISRAAKEAGVNRSTFDSRLRRLGISRARTGPGSGQAFSTK
jgi:transcriptional regulator with GAF, ATPase, and Fis domain